MASIQSGPDMTHRRAATMRGYSRICGVDEAGRGPLAGPVVCAAVILDASNIPPGLDDSKALSRPRRECLLNALQESAQIRIAIVEPAEVDTLNVLWASLAGMSRAIRGLRADYALIDGNRLPRDLPCDGEAIIKGDARSLSVAAASIVAKVTRDQLMIEAEARYPGYGFAGHKGYPTKAHKAALSNLGASPIHRMSYAPVREAWRQL